MVLFYVALFLQNIISLLCLYDYPHITYHTLYERGIQSYQDKQWHQCISFFRRALEDYKFFHKNILFCYDLCMEGEDMLMPSHTFMGEFEYFNHNINTTLCITKCRNEKFQYRPLLNREAIDEDFENLIPYEYLQYCYYKINDVENAIAHAYTYYLKNPQHVSMRENLGLYQTLPNVRESYFKNLEALYHQDFYLNGIQSYNNENWVEAIDYFDEALYQYYLKDKHCHLLCYGPFRKVFVYDFLSTISNLFALILKCNKKCIHTLNTLPGENYMEIVDEQSKNSKFFLDDYLRSHYHYLQYCHFKIGDLKSAAKYVATYFIFDPTSEDMVRNKNYYLSTGHVKQSDFIPEKTAILYHNRHHRESSLLEFIEDNFNPYMLRKPSPPLDLQDINKLPPLSNTAKLDENNHLVNKQWENIQLINGKRNFSIIECFSKSYRMTNLLHTCPLAI